jgi:hypothetical protein
MWWNRAAMLVGLSSLSCSIHEDAKQVDDFLTRV